MFIHVIGMLHDLAAILLSIVCLASVWLAPGYLLAEAFDLLNFREQSPWRRVGIGLLLSQGITPITLHLLSRAIGFDAAKWIVVPVALVFVFRFKRGEWRAWAVAGVWMILATAVTMDLRVSDRLYGAASWFDYTKHVAITSAIERTGAPPINPYFSPGEPVRLFYYYFWFIPGAAVDSLTHGWLGASAVVIGGMIWTGCAMIAVIALMAEMLLPRSKSWSVARVAVLLLVVTGVDIVPTLIYDLVRSMHSGFGLSRSVDGWNDQVTGFLTMMLWVPHHVGSAVAGLAAMMLLRRGGPISALIAGVCLSSAGGMSIYVACVFAVFLMVRALSCILYHRTGELKHLALVGSIAILLALPFLLELDHANLSPHPMIALRVREFWPAVHLLKWLGHDSTLLRQLSAILCLPLNYFMEFGLFGIAAIVYWRRRSQRATPDERFFVGLFWTSLLVATLLRSVVHENDFGWRAMIPAQVMLLIWSVLPVGELLASASAVNIGLFWSSRVARRVAVMLLVLGVSSTMYDLFLLRFVDVLQTSPLDAQRASAARETYAWIDHHFSSDAIVQANPDVPVEYFNGLYGHRQTVAAGEYYGTMYGVPVERYRPLQDDVASLFKASTNAGDAGDLCRRLHLQAIVIADSDPIWNAPASWTSSAQTVYTNDHYKVVEWTDIKPRPVAVVDATDGRGFMNAH